MTSSTKKGGARPPAKGAKSPARKAAGKSPTKSSGTKPDWTRGLRQLYDSVVDEPLPDEFKNLLDKLDKK